MCNKSAGCKSERQTQAGGNPVCPAGISWCGTAPCHVLFEAWGTKAFFFHKTPRHLCLHMIRCDQNWTILIICISNEQVNLQWAHIPWECCPGCSSTVVLPVYFCLSHRGQICIDYVWPPRTDIYWSRVVLGDSKILIMHLIAWQRQAWSLWHSGVCPCGKIWHHCCKVIEIDLLNPSHALNFFCSILSQW